MSYTPGPWRVMKRPGRDEIWSHDNQHLCTMIGKHDAEMANARLVEAAPQLLAALKWAVETINKLSTTYGIEHTSNDLSGTNWDKLFDAQAAIATATGQEKE